MTLKRLSEIKKNHESARLELINALKEVNQGKSFRAMAEILETDHSHLNRIVTGKQDSSVEKLIEYLEKLLA